MIGLSTAIAVVLLAAGVDQSGYLTGAPVPDWLALATAVGRDAVVLGDGCDVATPGMNVLMLDSDHLELVDPFVGPLPGACQLVRRLHMSDVPCAHNPQGQCDVAFD